MSTKSRVKKSVAALCQEGDKAHAGDNAEETRARFFKKFLGRKRK